MDYEKKLREALDSDETDYEVVRWIELTFPELAESEDERIRKWLVNYFTEIGENWIHREFTCKQIVAYLEKQKEQKPAAWKPQPEALEALIYAIEGKWEMIKPTSYLSRRLEDLYEELVDETFIADKDIEELKALKAETDASMEKESAEHTCANDESEYDKGYRDGHKFGLQQTENYTIGKTFKGLIPCWINAPSELQSAHQYHGKNVVIMHENNGGFRCVCIDDEKAVTFHLPDDVLLVEGWRKRNPEWSEEDKNRIQRICDFLWKNRKGDTDTIYQIEKDVDWLKSLRPDSYKNCNSRWKPSEEQMGVLWDALGNLKHDGYKNAEIVESLYEQLKKL